ncbi:hypothetical protein Rctr197k_204 [Virus Rctr197k]|nr:hypothetical protein Rctr197k_204 [Virus Rctr197k]
MRCPHCQKPVPERGYCCEKRELEALREVVDEVTLHLDSEIIAARSMGALDVVEPVAHATERLKRVRGRAA